MFHPLFADQLLQPDSGAHSTLRLPDKRHQEAPWVLEPPDLLLGHRARPHGCIPIHGAVSWVGKLKAPRLLRALAGLVGDLDQVARLLQVRRTAQS